MSEPQKEYRDMSDAELHAEMAKWGERVEYASGWPSAYFAAKQCRAIAFVAKARGLPIENKWPITVG